MIPPTPADERAAREIVEKCGHVPCFDDLAIQNLAEDESTEVACSVCIAAALAAQREKDAELCERVALKADVVAPAAGRLLRDTAAAIRAEGSDG